MPEDKPVRIIYGDGAFLTKLDHVQKNISKVFAVIGPFDNHQDKEDLQQSLKVACLAYNLECSTKEK